MKFNGSQFQVVRYAPKDEMKENTIYFTDKTKDIIEQYSSVRDFGVIISYTATFGENIERVSRTVRLKVSWILRTFHTRQTSILK